MSPRQALRQRCRTNPAFGVAIAAFLLACATPVWASTGCNTLNSGFSLSSNFGGPATSTVSTFAAGDTITISLTRAVAGAGSFRLSDGSGKVLIFDPAGGTAVTFRYAVLGTADTTLELRIVSTGTLVLTAVMPWNVMRATA